MVVYVSARVLKDLNLSALSENGQHRPWCSHLLKNEISTKNVRVNLRNGKKSAQHVEHFYLMER